MADGSSVTYLRNATRRIASYSAELTADYGSLGQHQKLSEHLGGIATIEMGARQYVPALGRFLQVDPVEGGTDDDYAYPNDPVDAFELTGQFVMFLPIFAVVAVVSVILTALVVGAWWVGQRIGSWLHSDGLPVIGRAFSKAKNPNAAPGGTPATDKEAQAEAEKHGYVKIKERSIRGRAIFKKKGAHDCITHDRGSGRGSGHNGGHRKRASSIAALNGRRTRGGTWNKALTHRIGD